MFICSLVPIYGCAISRFIKSKFTSLRGTSSRRTHHRLTDFVSRKWLVSSPYRIDTPQAFSWLKFNVHFQYKYGYIRDDTSQPITKNLSRVITSATSTAVPNMVHILLWAPRWAPEIVRNRSRRWIQSTTLFGRQIRWKWMTPLESIKKRKTVLFN